MTRCAPSFLEYSVGWPLRSHISLSLFPLSPQCLLKAKWRNSPCVVKRLKDKAIQEKLLQEFREESRVWMYVHVLFTPSHSSSLASLANH